MTKLVDVRDLKSLDHMIVWVRFPLMVPLEIADVAEEDYFCNEVDMNTLEMGPPYGWAKDIKGAA